MGIERVISFDNIDPALQLAELDKQDCEDDLYTFLSHGWRYIDPSVWRDGWPIEAVAEHLQAVVDGEIKRLLINIPPRCGKLLADDTPVLTTEGWKTHGELQIGDYVFTPSGFPTRVEAISDPAPANVRMEFFDGSVIYCHEDHEWVLYNRSTRTWETVEARVFLEPRRGRWGQTKGKIKQVLSDDRALYQLPLKCALQFPEADLKMPPYVLGAWLGDGSAGKPCISHAASDQPYIDKIVGLGYHISTSQIHAKTGVVTTYFSGSGGRSNPPRMTRELRELGVFTDKHIPQAYLNASVRQRLELLAGLIDTDGNVDAGSRCHFTTASRSLADGVIELVRSLGWRASEIEIEPVLSSSGIQGKRPYWVISFQPSMHIPTALERKRIKRVAPKRRIGLKSVSLDPCGKIGRCIQVAMGDGVYLAGRHLTPTHNSSITSVAFPAWTWIQSNRTPTSGPGVQFLCASYGNSLAMRDSVKCRRLIQSKWYQDRWGDRFMLSSDQNVKSRFSNDQGGERLITSVDATVTGEGGNIIIIDDPNAANEAFSEATIQMTKDWWDGTMSTRLNDQKTGAFVVIQQRLAEDDLTGHILEKEADDWCHLMLPMKYEAARSYLLPTGWKDPREQEGELLWPERFGDREVKILERALGPYGAAGQLQQRPEPAGGGIIKSEWWQTWEGATFPPMDLIIATVDTAYTTKQENDASAMSVWGVFSGDVTAQAVYDLEDGRPQFVDRSYSESAPKVMLMHAWQGRYEFHELVTRVNEVARKLRVDQVIIENKAAGISLGQELRRLYQNENYGIILHDPKNEDKMSRLYSVQHLFAEGMVYAPDKAWAQMMMDQVGKFPKGKHDDLVDTCSMAIRHLRNIGVLTRAPERLEEIAESKAFSNVKKTSPIYPA